VVNSAQERDRIRRPRLELTSMLQTAAIVFVLTLGSFQPALAQTFTVLHNFGGSPDGAFPYAGLIRDAAGELYGTTSNGGTSGLGTVFKVDISGSEAVLYSFTGRADGISPLAPLVRNSLGTLYGTTFAGGTSNNGTVFKLSKNGNETVLHSFAGGTTDGCNAYGGLIRDTSGNLYGTTASCGASNKGTVFKVNSSGALTLLHSFAGGASDGANPDYASLLMDKSGNLYGTTEYGGSANQGVLFKLSRNGNLTLLHSFAGGATDGCFALGTLIMDTNASLYGTAQGCGASGYGVVYKVSKLGKETVLHNFAGGVSDGAQPIAGVIMGAKGTLYGVTEAGGTSNNGAVFRLSGSTLTLLHSFSYTDGATPFGRLVRDLKGDLYGTTLSGGSNNGGTVWKIAP
jgi:uncharacterized repeat protein (TIGR03803 family)